MDELKRELAVAQAKIKELSDSGLRQRKGAGSAAAAAPTANIQEAARQVVEGVPVLTVAILCLISFLLAYFFF
jgi:hypothetical protein